MSARDIVIEIQYFSALALQIVIALSMFRRRLYRYAHFFFVYIVWQTFSVAILYGIRHLAPRPYRFYGYWTNNTVTVTLGLMIVIEIFKRIFEPYAAIRRMARILLLSAAALLSVIGGVLLFYSHTEYSGPILTFFLVVERSVRIVQLGLVLTLFAVTKYMHLRWKNYLFGIALGFGFYALIALALLAVRMAYGQTLMATVDLLFGTGYCAAVLIWTIYVLQPDAATTPITSLPSHELEHWNEVLTQVLSFKSASGARKPPTFDRPGEGHAAPAQDEDNVVR